MLTSECFAFGRDFGIQMFNLTTNFNMENESSINHSTPPDAKHLLSAGVLRVLVACEESDEVRSRLESLGWDAWSCDLQPNRNPKAKHFQCSVDDIINGYYECECGFIHEESTGKYGCCGVSKLKTWDMLIAFPPCTHLAVSGAAYFKQKQESGVQQEAIDFFLKLANADIKHIAIENPVGIMSKHFRKPDQIIHPYYFGDEARKKTCLWLKNLPPLKHLKEPNLFDSEVTHVSQGKIVNGYPAWMFNNDKKHRSKTFPGIAEAMAVQWSSYACR